jgi:hypothetical protein
MPCTNYLKEKEEEVKIVNKKKKKINSKWEMKELFSPLVEERKDTCMS